MDNNKDAVYIQQLRKYCKDNKKWNEIFPVTFIQAIYNAANGNRLDTLLAMYNSIFVEYKGSFATTVAAIDNILSIRDLVAQLKLEFKAAYQEYAKKVEGFL